MNLATETTPWDRGQPKVRCIECKARVPRLDAQPYDRHNRPNHNNPFWTRFYLCDECASDYTCEVCCEVVYDVSFDRKRRICEECAEEYDWCKGCSEWHLIGTMLRGVCRSCAAAIKEDMHYARLRGER